MYKDIITYELAENVSKEQLLTVAQEVVNNWMQKQPGFVSWEIHTNRDGGFTDIVEWKSEADAKNAEKEMGNIPNANEWFSCYKVGSISSKNSTSIGKF